MSPCLLSDLKTEFFNAGRARHWELLTQLLCACMSICGSAGPQAARLLIGNLCEFNPLFPKGGVSW